MRRTPIPLLVAAAVILIAGVAYARTIDCPGGECEGTNRADAMNGSPGDDKMLALDGADILYGLLGGMDMLKGKGGGDRIFGGEGNGKVKGGHGKDRVDGGAGNDLVRGQDVLKGCEIKRPSS